MKKSFFFASVLVAGILTVSIAQSSSETKAVVPTTLKATNPNFVMDTLPQKDTVPGTDTTGKKDSTTRF